MTNYHPEHYWSEVANRIKARKGKNIIAGDDEPFYRYKRKKFLSMLNTVEFKGKKVLELGCGPGGNLQEVWKKSPKRLMGADISADMLELSREKLPKEIELIKIDGTSLPFKDKEFDYAFTATVLQHNTNEEMLKKIMAELCRVSDKKVFLFERIEKTIKGDELCYGRPVCYYENICSHHGFKLDSKSFINIRISYYVSGIIRKVFSPKTRQEGEALSKTAILLQKLTLPITKQLDKIFKSKKDIAKLEFRRL
ncbi:MAG: methyltransferase domain-containing protein [Bacteroidales bacterium]|nr:methyltransferase domain-containing protein [Bacteroidales bacterium]